jgi:hypothetical protein
MEKKERGILLFNKISSENNLYVKILTDKDEIQTGLIFGGSTKKKEKYLSSRLFLEYYNKK